MRKLHLLAVIIHFIPVYIHSKLSDAKPAFVRAHHAAAFLEHQPDAGKQLLYGKRLCHIVIRTSVQTGNLIHDFIPRRQHYDRNVRIFPQTPQHLKAV